MQSIVDYSMLMAPTEVPQQHRRTQKSKRELRRQTALDEEEIDLCSSPPRRQLPPRNESMEALKEKLAGLQERLNKIESKVVLIDYSRSNFLSHPTRLTTIYECEDETSLEEEQ